MSLEALRSLARLHALVAWLATAALFAALLAHAGRRRGRALVSTVAAALVIATSALGVSLHDGFRARVRQKLFLASATLGWLFERKLHLAFGATLLAVSALATAALLSRAEARGDALLVKDLRRASLIAWSASALLALAASIASAIAGRNAAF